MRVFRHAHESNTATIHVMAQILNRPSPEPPPAALPVKPGLQAVGRSLRNACAVILLLSVWTSAAIAHFQKVEGGYVLYGMPRWHLYLFWASEVQAWVGLVFLIASSIQTFFVLLTKYHSPFWVHALNFFLHLFALGALVFFLESIGMDNGLLP